MFPNLEDENLDEATRKWLKTMPDNKVFLWLGDDKPNQTPKHLRLLNLHWSEKGADSDLQIFIDIARRLAEEPEYLRQMIRTVFWRHTLVACVSVILLEAKEYCVDLAESFKQPNFVSPQIAVALGLLCPNEAVSCLSEVVGASDFVPSPENWKQHFTIYRSPKAIVAAQTVLSKIKPELAAKLAESEVFQHHKNHLDGQIAAEVTEHHWKFWSDVMQRCHRTIQ